METKVFRGRPPQRMWLIAGVISMNASNFTLFYPQLAAFFVSPSGAMARFSVMDWLMGGVSFAYILLLLFVIYQHWLYGRVTLRVDKAGITLGQVNKLLATYYFFGPHALQAGQTIAFSDITSLDSSESYGQYSLLVHTQARSFYIPVNRFEHPDEIVKMMVARASQADVKPGVRKIAKPDYFFRFYMLALLVYFVFVALPNPVFRVMKSLTWHEVYYGLSLKTYSLDADGSVWSVTSQGWDKDQRLFVRKHGPEGWKVWDNPPLACEKCYNLRIGHDQAGNPSIIDLGNKNQIIVYTWDGRKWGAWVAEGNFYVQPSSAVGYDGAVWGETKTALMRLNDSLRSVERFDLPAGVVDQGYTIKESHSRPDGSQLVTLSHANESEKIYLFDGALWQAQAFAPAGKSIAALTIDPTGAIWAVFHPISFDASYNLGKYNPKKQTWLVYNLQPTEPFPVSMYQSIHVDVLGRVWLDGDYQDRGLGFVRVLRATDAGLISVVEYEDINSSIGWGKFSLASDHRLWSQSSAYLAWVDTSAENLPQPLPAWFSWPFSLGHGQWMLLLPLAGMPVLGLALLAIWLAQRAYKRRLAAS